MQTTIHLAPDHQRVCEIRRSRQTSSAVIRPYVGEKEERLQQSPEAASGDPAISPSRKTDYTRLRESSVGSPEKSDAAGQTTGMRVSLDAGFMEKGEMKLHFKFHFTNIFGLLVIQLVIWSSSSDTFQHTPSRHNLILFLQLNTPNTTRITLIKI